MTAPNAYSGPMHVSLAGYVAVESTNGYEYHHSMAGTRYRGIERPHFWPALEEAYYFKRVPERFAAIAKDLISPPFRYTHFGVCQDLSLARSIVEWIAERGVSCELLGVDSIHLRSTFGHISVPKGDVTRLGLDVFGHGEWSLVRSGVMVAPECFAPWSSRLNKNGLFDSVPDLVALRRAYDEAAEQHRTEPIGEDSQIEIVQIYLPK